MINKKRLLKILSKAPDENDRWDFKQKWYGKNKKVDLLVDIMNFTNTVHHEECYIIIGVNDEDGKIVGIDKNDPNRYDKQQLQEFLRKKPFAQNFYPKTDVNSFNIFDAQDKIHKLIDVITIFDEDNVPIFLAQEVKIPHCHPLKAGLIYSRMGDSNTERDRSTSDKQLEKLFRKRLRLDVPILSRYKYVMKDKENWSFIKHIDYQPERYIYNLDPNFIIEISEENQHYGNLVEEFSYSQTRPRISWRNCKLIFNHIIVREILGCYLNEYRMLVAMPQCKIDENYGKYYFYYKDSLEFVFTNLMLKLQNFNLIYPESFTDTNFRKDVLFFKDKNEEKQILFKTNNFLKSHSNEFEYSKENLNEFKKKIQLNLNPSLKENTKYLDLSEIMTDHKLTSIMISFISKNK